MKRVQRGLSLVELMVALAIGLVLTLAIFAVLNRGEGLKRTTTTLNDVNQTSAYAAYLLDRQLRNAGSGLAQGWATTFGCRLAAARDGVAMLPRTTDFPAPFAAVPRALRVAPVIVHANGANAGADVRGDLLVVMSGQSGLAEAPQRINVGGVTATTVQLPTALGLRANDLLMLSDDGTNCMLQQVVAGHTPTADTLVTLGGRYAVAATGGVQLTGFAGGPDNFAVGLGNAVDNFPQFLMFGVGPNNTLFSYDALRQTDPPAGDIATSAADGVVELRALYGVDTTPTPDGVLDAWVAPTAAPWRAADLMAGDAAARENLRRIVAVRVGLILRSQLPERDDVSPLQLTLFDDLGPALTYTRDLAALPGARQFRYRTVESTVPLRNVLMLRP
jgi:type IV pilus assembly protein PilW